MRARGLAGLALLMALSVTSCSLFNPPAEMTIGLTPASGAVNTVVTITGAGFGSAQGTSVVTFDGVQADVSTWADTTVVVEVPVLPTPNGERAIAVDVVRGGSSVGAAQFILQRGILFETNRDGNPEIYIMNPDGSSPKNLTNHPSDDGSAAWSPDGTKIAFVTYRTGNAEIYVMNADGSGVANLTNHSKNDTYPVWSPDGTRIAFQTDRESTGMLLSVDPKITLPGFDIEVFVMNANGSGQTNVSDDPAWDAYPSWSPDSDRIVFESARDDTGIVLLDLGLVIDGLGHEVYVVDADGSNLTNLSNSPEDDGRPMWSPTADKILFVSYRDGNAEIYVMNDDGTGQTRLTSNPASDTYASWSPDGKWITFHSDRDGNTEIYKMSETGTSTTRLTTSADWDWGPSWSPDGDAIVFQTSRDGNSEIYRMSPSGAFQERLTNNSSWDIYPLWGTLSWFPPA
jgi:Tol biopolymer transport system component